MEACTALCGTFSCVLGWLNDHAALGVAVLAVWFTSRQVKIANRHNRLSVQPRLVLWLDESAAKNGNPIITVTVKNVGLGPAYLVKPPVFRVDGRVVNVQDSTEGIDALVNLFGDRYAEARRIFVLLGDYAIAKDDKLTLVELEGDPALASSFKETLLRRVSVEIPYRSTYKETFECQWPPTA